MVPIELFSVDPAALVIDRRMALRFLGCPADSVPDTVQALLKAQYPALLRAADFRACFRKVPIRVEHCAVISDAFRAESADLAKNLAGCTEALLFAATSGVGVDRLIALTAKRSPADAAALDALASAAIEAFCDVAEAAAVRGAPHKPRFSPGYGDLPLSLQKELLGLLDADRTLGLTLTGALTLTPTKSVTALIGLCGSSGE